MKAICAAYTDSCEYNPCDSLCECGQHCVNEVLKVCPLGDVCVHHEQVNKGILERVL